MKNRLRRERRVFFEVFFRGRRERRRVTPRERMMNKDGQDFWEKGFEEWKKWMQSMGQAGAQGSSIFEEGQAFWKKSFEAWQEQMQPAWEKGFEEWKNMSAMQDFWAKAAESQKTYAALSELWQQLTEKSAAQDSQGVLDVYAQWNGQYANLLRSGLMPNVPDYIKEYSEKWIDNLEQSGETMLEHIKTWTGTGEALLAAIENTLNNSPNAYIELMEAWKKTYEETFGLFARNPVFGKDMAFWQRHKDSFDRFVKFNIAATGFYTAMYEVIRESTLKVMEDYAALSAKGEEPKSFDEFYSYWAKQVSATYDKVLFSEQYGRLAGNMVDEMAKFRLAYDALCESYLTQFPVPKKSDMDELHKTVYELKKELRALKKEIEDHATHELGDKS